MGNTLPKQAPEASTTPLGDLPDHCLARIFAAAGAKQGSSLALVCRRWHDLYYSDPAVWRQLELVVGRLHTQDAGAQLQWAAARRRLLQQVGQLVAAVKLRDPEAAFQIPGRPSCTRATLLDFAEALSLLEPRVLTSASLLAGHALPEAAVAGLARFGRLACLRLESEGLLPPNTAAVLERLQQLEHLGLYWVGWEAPSGLCGAISRLPLLRRLEVHSARLPPGLAEALAALAPRLRGLRCRAGGGRPPGRHGHPLLRLEPEQPGGLLAAIAGCTTLTELRLDLPCALPPASLLQLSGLAQLRWLEVQEGAAQRPALRLPPLAAFASLEAADVAADPRAHSMNVNGGLEGLLQAADGSQLHRCRLEPAEPLPGAPGAYALHLEGLQGTADLESLLSSLLPAGAALAALSITNSRLDASAASGCDHLAATTSLRLSFCAASSADDASLDAALVALLQQAPQLQHLSLQRCTLAHLSCLGAASSCLKRVELSGLQLPSIVPPAGVLSGLEQLTVELHARGITMPWLAAELAAATSLRQLAMGPFHQLDTRDVLGVVSRLPLLESLQLPFSSPPTVAAQALLGVRQRRLALSWRPEHALSRLTAMHGRQFKIFMFGLDAGGKTTVLYKLGWGLPVQRIPTIGFHMESVSCRNVGFVSWDVGGGSRLGPLYRSVLASERVSALVYVVDALDCCRLLEAGDELHRMLADAPEQLCGLPLLVLANKQDLPHVCSEEDVESGLMLRAMRGSRPWRVQACCAVTGQGVYAGLEWLSEQVAARLEAA